MAYVKGQPFIPQFTDPATGLLMTSGTIEFYLTGTSTPTPYYTDSAGTSGGTSLTLDSGGQPSTDIYFDTGITYKLVVKNAAGTTLRTIEPYAVTGSSGVKDFATLAAAIADAGLVEGDVIQLKERTSGYGGGGVWDVVLSSTVTENTYNIVQCTGVGTLSLVLREEPFVIHTAQYGVVGDGSETAGTDNSPALQYIFDNMNSRSEVILPSGRIRILSQLNLGVSRTLRIKLRGQGSPKTELIAGAAMTSMISLPTDLADYDQCANSFFEGFILNANSNAQYCMKGLSNYSTWRDVTFTLATSFGTDISYGWNNCFYNCYWLSNKNCHTTTEGQANANFFYGCKFASPNSGITDYGCKILGSYGVGFSGCTWEWCEKGSIITWGVEGLSVTNSCYFDNNGEVGHTFTTPSTTVNADIILNGSNSFTSMGTANPTKGVCINAPFVSQSGTGAHTFVYGVGTESVSIISPTLLTSETSDLFTTYGSTTESSQYSRNEGLRIISPSNFTNNIVVENSTTGFDGKPDMIMDKASSFNILPDMSTWTAIVGGAASTFVSSSEVHPLGPLIDVYELDAGASTSTSESYGVTLTATNYANLTGKPMLACIDVKNETSGATTTVTVNGWDDTHTATTWRTFYVIFNMPASGTFNFTVKKTGNADRTFVAMPRLVELGADVKQMIG